MASCRHRRRTDALHLAPCIRKQLATCTATWNRIAAPLLVGHHHQHTRMHTVLALEQQAQCQSAPGSRSSTSSTGVARHSA